MIQRRERKKINISKLSLFQNETIKIERVQRFYYYCYSCGEKKILVTEKSTKYHLFCYFWNEYNNNANFRIVALCLFFCAIYEYTTTHAKKKTEGFFRYNEKERSYTTNSKKTYAFFIRAICSEKEKPRPIVVVYGLAFFFCVVVFHIVQIQRCLYISSFFSLSLVVFVY